MTEKYLDFRSDTVTQPTAAMRAAMSEAEVGDDILGEDPSVRRLEHLAAELFGKEAALFVISGTMANQVAIMTLTERGDEIIAGDASHLYNTEVSGVAVLSGVQVRPLPTRAGRFDPADLVRAIRSSSIQTSATRLLCLENTYDLTRGIPLDPEYQQAMADIAHQRELSVYLDGARIFNAALAAACSVRTLCAPIDCLQFCLSKGLAAPVGALLVGPQAFIDRARRMRQRIGGGMRQAGHMAAAGIVALETMRERLAEDHANASRLAQGLAEIDERIVDLAAPRTNIVHIDLGAAGRQAAPVVAALRERRIRIRAIDETRCRMITHWGIDAADVDNALAAFAEILRKH